MTGLAKAFSMKPEGVIEEIKQSGLVGRGGAAFPTAMKWDFARKAPGDSKIYHLQRRRGRTGYFQGQTHS